MRRHGTATPIARYGLGSLSGSSLGSVQSTPRFMREDVSRKRPLVDVALSKRDLGADIEMPEECMRPGEILLSPGVCGPDTRRPVNPYASSPPTTAIPVSTTKEKAAAMGLQVKSDKTKLYVLGGVALAAIFLLGRR